MVTNTGKVVKRRTSSQRLVKAMYPILNYMRYKNRFACRRFNRGIFDFSSATTVGTREHKLN
jgi:hypothetical protein